LSKLARYRDGAPRHPRCYLDLHEHVLALERAGLLVVVDETINKDTEMHPLVRWQYRGGIPEPERKAFLFHRSRRIPKAVASISRCWSRALPPTPRSTA